MQQQKQAAQEEEEEEVWEDVTDPMVPTAEPSPPPPSATTTNIEDLEVPLLPMPGDEDRRGARTLKLGETLRLDEHGPMVRYHIITYIAILLYC